MQARIVYGASVKQSRRGTHRESDRVLNCRRVSGIRTLIVRKRSPAQTAFAVTIANRSFMLLPSYGAFDRDLLKTHALMAIKQRCVIGKIRGHPRRPLLFRYSPLLRNGGTNDLL
jgi:hypothetical protein